MQEESSVVQVDAGEDERLMGSVHLGQLAKLLAQSDHLLHVEASQPALAAGTTGTRKTQRSPI